MARSEGGVRAGRGEAAASAVLKLVCAAGGGVAGIGVSGFDFHFRCPFRCPERLRFGVKGYATPPGVCMSIKRRELREKAFA